MTSLVLHLLQMLGVCDDEEAWRCMTGECRDFQHLKVKRQQKDACIRLPPWILIIANNVINNSTRGRYR
jgi:hypothetical protein